MIKVIGIILLLAGIGFCIAAFMGHSQAWSGAALCFFASTMIFVWKQRKQ